MLWFSRCNSSLPPKVPRLSVWSVFVAALTSAAALHGQVSVLTWHNDNARTGQNLQETTLTPANVNPSTFGLLFTIPVDGKVDAQPLYVPALTISGAQHNVLYVVTEHDSVYAFDADNGTELWQVSMLGAGETTSDDRSCGQVDPEIGITSTPVIDPQSGANGTIYVVAISKDASGNYHQRLHALDLTTGAEEFNGPVEIRATYPGSGDGSAGGVVTFDPGQYKERAALLLVNGVVYTSWASHCDIRPYTGWIIGYNESSLAQVSVLNVSPNGEGASIWAAGAGPAADPGGFLYLMTANGTFDTTLNADGFPNHGDYGNAFVKISTGGGSLSVTDYWTMSNTVSESNDDVDLGSGGLILLPTVQDAQGAMRNLTVGAGKDGNIYVVDTNNMGKFDSSRNNIYQQLSGVLPGGAFSTPAWFNGNLYYGGMGDALKAFPFTGGVFATTPASQTAQSFPYPGATPSISANGSSNAIVWTAENSDPAVLHAFDAGNLATELYNSNMAANNRDHFGTGNKFIVPTVANGKVYVGTTNSVGAFGLLCSYVVGSQNTSIAVSGGSGQVKVQTASGCPWTAASPEGWITISAGASGTGNGTVSFTAAPNRAGFRSGTIVVAGKPVTISQTGGRRAAGDFDGNGVPDLVWQNDSTFQVAVWLMGGVKGAQFQAFKWIDGNGHPGWSVATVADLNQDGVPDIIWQNTNGEAVVWYMGGSSGTQFQNWSWLQSSPLANWKIIGAADLNGDGVPDLLWQNTVNAQVAVWYMSGADGNQFLSFGMMPSAPAGWNAVGLADFDGDGHPDLVWQNATSRQAVVWFMGGPQGNEMTSWAWLQAGTNTSTWKIVGLADVDENGYPDLIWQEDNSRAVEVWLMAGTQGSSTLGSAILASTTTGWHAQMVR